MPFLSKKQSKWAFANGEPWATEWANKTDYSKLPEKKSKNTKVRSVVQKKAAKK